MSSQTPELGNADSSGRHEGPGYPYYKNELGNIALKWINTKVIKFESPKDSFVQYAPEDPLVHTFKVPGDVLDDLGRMHMPMEYYPSMKEYEYWTGKVMSHTPISIDSPELELVLENEQIRKLHYLNARLRTFADTPEANHIEYVASRSTVERLPINTYGNIASQMFFDGFPISSLPVLQMDHNADVWFKQNFGEFAEAA
jgi:hypothetical protein